MGKIHHIYGDEIKSSSGVNEICIEGLESLLEKARNGEVVGVSIAAQHPDGSTTGYCSGFLYNARIVGELMIQVTRLSK